MFHRHTPTRHSRKTFNPPHSCYPRYFFNPRQKFFRPTPPTPKFWPDPRHFLWPRPKSFDPRHPQTHAPSRPMPPTLFSWLVSFYTRWKLQKMSNVFRAYAKGLLRWNRGGGGVGGWGGVYRQSRRSCSAKKVSLKTSQT